MPEIIKSKKEVTEETTEELEYINFGFLLHLKMPKPNRQNREQKNVSVTFTMVNEGYLFLI